MKTRATSFLLAALAVVSLVLPALAAEPAEMPEEFPESPVESAEIVEEVESAICLDGEPVDSVEYEIRNGVCYVTVRSFVSMLDPEAVVEEEDGIVRVSATTVTQIIPVVEAAEGGEAAVDAGNGEAAVSAEDSEPAEIAEDSEPAEIAEDGGAAEAAEAGEPAENAGDGAPVEGAEIGEPVRESLAANVVTADLDLLAAVGGAYFLANGRYLYVDGGLIDLNGSAAAPVRQLARVFNLTVGFDSLTGQVLLNHQEGVEPYLTSGDAAYDNDTLYWLSRIIYCESGNQPLVGKIAVGNVVMNRVNDSRFPDTLYDVLFQTNQFTPAATGSIYRDPNWDSVVAAKLVMDGAQVTDALFFNAAGARTYAARTRTYIATIGDHAFYK